jgi:ribose transport system substrate-binding protein
MTKKRVKSSLVPVALASAALLAAACGSSSKHSSSTASGGSSSGVAHASAVVASLSKPTTKFTPPGPPLERVNSLKGKSVWYIPISLSAPVFAVGNSALHTALGKAGITVHACSGEANPSATAACINQAVARGAGAIITDAVPVVLAANAFASAESHHVPVLIVNQLPPPKGLPGAVQGNGTDKLAYALSQDTTQVKAVAEWAIADSGGKANVLMETFTDSPSTIAYGAAAQAAFKQDCPGCKVTVQKVGLANANLIPSQTSSALLSHSGINYVLPEFDAVLQPVTQGIQQAGFTKKVKVATSGGDLPALVQVKAGHLAAEVGEDFPYAGWADADEVMRMMLGMPVVTEHVPVRMFTASNVGSLRLTPAAQASGEWYGGNGYISMFEHLWGVH